MRNPKLSNIRLFHHFVEPAREIIVEVRSRELTDEIIIGDVAFHHRLYPLEVPGFCFYNQDGFGLLGDFVVVVIHTGNGEEVHAVREFLFQKFAANRTGFLGVV